MSSRLGILVFSRFESRRLPGKALRQVGGMPLLERVIRRAQLCGLPVHLATTDRASDDALVALAASIGITSFRGSADLVLDRAVGAAEAFGLHAFIRLCGDRPLFPVDDLRRAVAEFRGGVAGASRDVPDLITTYSPGLTARGLTTELIRTSTLRTIRDLGVSVEQQEHVTAYLYDNADQFRIVQLPDPPTGYACPGFAVDTKCDLDIINGIFAVRSDVDLTVSEADRIYLR